MAKEKPKKKGNMVHKIYAVLIILLGVTILAMIAFIVFHTQSLEVKGLDYSSEQEVAEWIEKDKGAMNTLYLLWKYNTQNPEVLPFLDSVKVKLKAPWAVVIEAQEKKIAGHIESDDCYYYFDKEGLVVLVTAAPLEGIPRIEGMEFGEMALYEKLKTEDDSVFEHILEVTQFLKKEELKPDKILSDGKNITLYFGTICAELGSGGYAYKIAQLPPVLEKLEGESGVLKMSYYDESSKYISFRKGNPDEQEDSSEDGENISTDTEDGSDSSDYGDESESGSTDSEDGDDGTSDYGDDSTSDYSDGEDSYDESSDDSLDYGDNIDSADDSYGYDNDSEE